MRRRSGRSERPCAMIAVENAGKVLGLVGNDADGLTVESGRSRQ